MPRPACSIRWAVDMFTTASRRPSARSATEGGGWKAGAAAAVSGSATTVGPSLAGSVSAGGTGSAGTTASCWAGSGSPSGGAGVSSGVAPSPSAVPIGVLSLLDAPGASGSLLGAPGASGSLLGAVGASSSSTISGGAGGSGLGVTPGWGGSDSPKGGASFGAAPCAKADGPPTVERVSVAAARRRVRRTVMRISVSSKGLFRESGEGQGKLPPAKMRTPLHALCRMATKDHGEFKHESSFSTKRDAVVAS